MGIDTSTRSTVTMMIMTCGRKSQYPTTATQETNRRSRRHLGTINALLLAGAPPALCTWSLTPRTGTRSIKSDWPGEAFFHGPHAQPWATLAMRANLPQSSVESAIQMLDLSQIWVEEQGFYSDLTASEAAVYVFAKLRYIPGGQQHSAVPTVVQAFSAFLRKSKRGLPCSCKMGTEREREGDLVRHIDFEWSVFTPFAWVEVLRFRSALTANWPLHPVGTQPEAITDDCLACESLGGRTDPERTQGRWELHYMDDKGPCAPVVLML